MFLFFWKKIFACYLRYIFFSSDMFVTKKKGMGGFVVDKRNGSRQKKILTQIFLASAFEE